MAEANASGNGGAPTIVLVHGGFADGSGWQGVYDLLKDDYGVRIVQEPNLSHQGDVEATKMITGAQSEPVILVGHSYGGAVISEAGNAPEVAALVYIAAFAPDQGESVETILGTFPPGEPNAGDAILPPQDGFLFLDREKFHEQFAGDVSADEAAFMADSQVPWGVEALSGTISEAAWRSKPRDLRVAAGCGGGPDPQRCQRQRLTRSSEADEGVVVRPGRGCVLSWIRTSENVHPKFAESTFHSPG